MSLSLKKIESSITTDPPVGLIYGVDGVGKTSLAAEFPSPIYLPTGGERTPAGIDLPTPGQIETFDDLLDIMGELATQPHDYKTVIIDSLDGLEPLVWAATCARIGARTIADNHKESPSAFGKGYVAADEEWGKLMTYSRGLSGLGINVLLLAHPNAKTFEDPTSDPYARWQIKLQERASSLVRERSDFVAFLNYRKTIKEKDAGFNKKTTRAEGGGDRMIYLEERPGFVAKNRYSMPDSIPYQRGRGYAELAKYLPAPPATDA